MAGDSRMSSVSSLKARPSSATRTPCRLAKCLPSSASMRAGCARLVAITASSSGIGMPRAAPCAESALVSLGRQLPP